MRAIEDSPWLDSPALVVISATNANGARVSEFTLTFNLTKAQVDAAAGAAVKPAGPKG
jgi:type IV pilus assembly protein PilN